MTALMQDAGDSPSRWLHLQGACNVRDLGGLPTPHGRTRAGVLLRSDDLQDLTPWDVDVLANITEVSLVLDLRSEAEVELNGAGPLVAAGVEHVNLPIMPQLDATALPSADRTLDAYRSYLVASEGSVREALRLIAEPRDGAVLVHCAAGKDRTGVVVALALTLAGVRRDVVVRDYAATADVVPAILARLREREVYREMLAGRPLGTHLPRAETMQALLAGLDPTLVEWAGADLQAALVARLTGA